MPSEQLQREYHSQDLQFVSINRSGEILTTDQQLFELDINRSIKEFHPFFENLEDYFENSDKHFKLECVHVDDRIYDIDFLMNPDETAVVIFREGTGFYNRVQAIAQKRNESLISQESLELKNQMLHEQEEFKNVFIRNFSHELRNPLTLVSAFSSMLLKTELNLDQEMLVEAVKDQSDKLRDILNDIIDLSILKSHSLSLENKPFSLNKLLKKIHLNYTTAIASRNINISLDVEPNVPRILIGDSRRIEQIITNFLDNALRYGKGDKLQIKVIENQRRANKVNLRIEVRNDHGSIPDMSNSASLEEYASLDKGDLEKTTGLSFSIARELAQLMDGKIAIKQIENGGTSQIADVKLVFPLHDSDIEEIPEKKSKNKMEFSEKVRTIVAEDNSVTQMTALKVLVSSGNFDTQVFTDPKYLLDSIEKDDYDLILMSSSISHIDAIELISLINQFANEHNKKIPVIAVTTKTLPDEVSAYKKAGFKDVVKKPYTDDELLNTIYKRLNLKKFK